MRAAARLPTSCGSITSMRLDMSRPLTGWPKAIVITGASRGLGAALALAYAREGAVLGLVGRDRAALAEVEAQCRQRGAQVETLIADLTLASGFADWVGGFDDAHRIDLVIANAGAFDGRREAEEREAIEQAVGLVRINLEAAMRTVDAVLPRLVGRRSGTVALVSSLAAVHPLADAPGYSASKAGLDAYGEALAEALAPSGVKVAVVLPGHIATRQTETQAGALPLLMTPEAAAMRIVRGLARGRGRIVFPRRLALAIRLNRLLPRRLRFALGRSFRFHVRDAGDGGPGSG